MYSYACALFVCIIRTTSVYAICCSIFYLSTCWLLFTYLFFALFFLLHTQNTAPIYGCLLNNENDRFVCNISFPFCSFMFFTKNVGVLCGCVAFDYIILFVIVHLYYTRQIFIDRQHTQFVCLQMTIHQTC